MLNMLEEKSKFWETILVAGLSALATGLANLIIEEIKERKKKNKKTEQSDEKRKKDSDEKESTS